MDANHKGEQAGSHGKLLLAGVVAVPMLYALSLGPCVKLYHPSRMAGWEGLPRRVKMFYRPLFWTAYHSAPFSELMWWYTDAWTD